MKWLTNLGRFIRRAVTWETFGLVAPPRAAGVAVTPSTALGVSAVHCADRVISEGVGCLPLHVFRKRGKEKDRQDGHPLESLAWNPNPDMTGPVFWQVLQHHSNIYGFKLAEIVRTGDGRPAELWPIHPANARVERKGGQLTFAVMGEGQRWVPLPSDDVFFVPGHGPDGSVGFKLLEIARDTIGSAIAARKHGAAVFGNGARPGGLIRVKGLMSKTAHENLRASWNELYGGPEKAGKVGILEEDSEFQEFETQHNQQLQLAELQAFLVVEVARFFNVTPVKLHELGRATWGNLSELNRDFATTTLRPILTKDSAEADRKLLTPGEQADGYYTEHQLGELLRADQTTRYAAYATAVNVWMTVNEVRSAENLPPLPGGDVLTPPPATPTPTPQPAAEDSSNGTDPPGGE